MKAAYADVVAWLQCSAAAAERERLLAANILASLPAAATRLREALAMTVLLVGRTHAELIRRTDEMFAVEALPSRASEVETMFDAAGETAESMSILVASISARANVECRHPDRFDSYTRFVLRVQRTLAEQMVLPSLRDPRSTDTSRAELDATWLARFTELYTALLPAPREHRDDFLEILASTERVRQLK